MNFSNSLTRRVFLLKSSVALAAVAWAYPAFAQDVTEDTGDQAEWVQSYDAATSKTLDRSTAPLLSPGTLAATEAAIEAFKSVVANGGWPQVQNVPLKLGMQSPAVVDLRKRLIASNDLDPSVGLSEVFDSFVETGVKRFQELHGLRPSGLVTRQTITALNIPADIRLKQLEVNVVRLRSYASNPGKRFVTANIPGALVETVEDGVHQKDRCRQHQCISPIPSCDALRVAIDDEKDHHEEQNPHQVLPDLGDEVRFELKFTRERTSEERTVNSPITSHGEVLPS